MTNSPVASEVPLRTAPRGRRPARPRSAPAALGLCAIAAIALTGCGASVNVGSGKTINIDEVKAAIDKQYAAQGIALSKLDCKDDVELKAGAPISCSAANAKGTILNIGGSVTSTEGNGGRFRVRTVSAAVDGTKIADQARALLEKQAGQQARSLTCPDTIPIPTKPDVTCELTATDGSKVDVTVTLDAKGNLSVEAADKVKSGPTS